MTRFFIATILALFALPGLAHDYSSGGLTIMHPHIFATAPNAPVAGAYMTIENQGPDDVLLAAEVPETKAGRVALHNTSLENGIMRMVELEGGLAIPAGETVTLESGGSHLMLMQLPQGLSEGDLVPATLTFRDAGVMHVVFLVEGRGRSAMDHSGHGS